MGVERPRAQETETVKVMYSGSEKRDAAGLGETERGTGAVIWALRLSLALRVDGY